MKIKQLIAFVIVLSYSSINAQNKERIYENTFNLVDSMLTGTKPINFQQAVYLTEKRLF
ncbi:hypothetical protein RDV77_01050 [Porphyromonadaceae sp. NP-X]|nr:hypothetical protein [Porphyromonadaceae sp. NP-X]